MEKSLVQVGVTLDAVIQIRFTIPNSHLAGSRSHPCAGSILAIMPKITTGDGGSVPHSMIEHEYKELNSTASSTSLSSAVSFLGLWNAGRRLFHFDPDVHTTIKEMNMDTILTNSLLRGERGCWYGKSTQRVGRCIIKSVVLQETPREFRHSLDKYVQSG